jgi:hypothetical protein
VSADVVGWRVLALIRDVAVEDKAAIDKRQSVIALHKSGSTFPVVLCVAEMTAYDGCTRFVGTIVESSTHETRLHSTIGAREVPTFVISGAGTNDFGRHIQ